MIDLFFVLYVSQWAYSKDFAEKSQWKNLAAACQDLSISGLEKTIRSASDWSTDVKDLNTNLQRMTFTHCPAYIANPNSPENLSIFNAKMSSILLSSPSISKKGKDIKLSLMEKYDEAQRKLKKIKVDFKKSTCGSSILRRIQFVKTQNSQIDSQTKKLEKKCPLFAQKLEQKDRKLATSGFDPVTVPQKVGIKSGWGKSGISKSKDQSQK